MYMYVKLLIFKKFEFIFLHAKYIRIQYHLIISIIMSKRKVRRGNEETYEISIHNEIFIPDVPIKYGAYKDDQIEDDNNPSDNDEEKENIGDFVNNNEEDGYDKN